jgi:hypothetical protein
VESRPRFRWSLGAAIAAHAAVSVWMATARPARVARDSSTRPTEIDIDVESLLATEPSPAIEPAAASVGGERVAGAQPPATGIAARRERASAAEAPAPDVAGGGESWTFSPNEPAPAGTQLSSAALDDAVHAGVRASVAEGRTKSDPLKSVLGGFSQHDIDLGLVPGGQLVSLTRDTVRTSNAPVTGRATLELEVDANGAVVSVHVLDASSDWKDWEEVAAEIARAARTRTSNVPRGSRGFALKLDVTSSLRTVSGRAPTDQAFTKVFRALADPMDAIIDGTNSVQRVVAARIVDLQVL